MSGNAHKEGCASFECTFCEEKFDTREVFFEHVKLFHPDVYRQIVAPDRDGPSLTVEKEKKND
jgi:hypothetical protein